VADRRNWGSQPVETGGQTVEEGRSVSVEYKVVEISIVTDEAIESVLNEWVAQGWVYDGIQFAMRDASPRPAMAFVTFKKESEGSAGD
jgi:hypothetical protein